MNFATGLGTFMRDKVMAGFFIDPVRVTDPELQALYHGNSLAARIVEMRPKEMFRRGYEVTLPDPEGDDGQNENDEIAEDLEKYAAKLRANEIIKDGMVFGNLFGGSVVIMGADDGQDPSMPLNEDNIKSVRYLNMIDRRFLFARQWYGDPFDPKYGQVEIYQITNAFGDQQNTFVHESRVLRFDGAPVDILKRRMLAGWTLSLLQRPYDTLRAFGSSFQAAANLMIDASQAVFSMKGLMDIISSDNANILSTRMAAVDYTRSSGRAVLVDAEEEKFERTNTSFAGIPDMLDRFMQLMASDCDMPVTILFGRSPAGMNATGDADFRHWYDSIATEQKNILEPALVRLYTLICKAKDGPTAGIMPDHGIEIKFAPLWQPTESEQADLELKMGQRDVAYVTAGILHPEEVALSRFGGAEFSMKTEIDVDSRKAGLAAELDFTQAEKEMRAEQGPQQMQEVPGQQPSPTNGPLPGQQGANRDPSSGRGP